MKKEFNKGLLLAGFGSFPCTINSIVYDSVKPSGNSYYNSVIGLNDKWIGITPLISNTFRWLLLHETGHTLGLRHQFDTDPPLLGTNSQNSSFSPGKLNQNFTLFTVMSYNNNFFTNKNVTRIISFNVCSNH